MITRNETLDPAHYEVVGEKEPAPEPPTKPSAQQEETDSSLRIFFILMVLLIAIVLVYLLIRFKFHYLPESIAIVMLGWSEFETLWNLISVA